MILLTASFLAFSLAPQAPTTGDPVRVVARVALSEDCDWQASAGIGFGAAEDGASSWLLDIALTPAQEICAPTPLELPIDLLLGTLGVADAPGVARLRARGVVEESVPFHLEVRAGPAAGWEQPALHGRVIRLTQAAGLTAVPPERLAMSDLGRRRILLIDPATAEEISSFPAPGSGNVRGLAWSGADLFASVRDTIGPRLYRLDLIGRVLDVFASPTIAPANAPLEGLAFHGGVLYGSHDSPPYLFAIDPVQRRKLWERPLPVRMPALDAVPAGLIGIEPGGLVYFIEPRPDGRDVLLADTVDNGITGTTDIIGFGHDGARGFAWDALNSRLLSIRPYALWWALDGPLSAYVPEGGLAVDVVRGDVEEVVQLSGNIGLRGAVCLMSRGAGGEVAPDADPPPGRAWFYVARFIAADGFPMSYGRSSAGFRRIDTNAVCP